MKAATVISALFMASNTPSVRFASDETVGLFFLKTSLIFNQYVILL